MSSSLKHVERSPEKIHYVGKSLPRPDAKTKVTGSAQYVMDFFPDDLLYAKLIQSTHSHAEIVDIDISKAVILEGVVGIFTSDDVPSIRRGQFILDQPIFAIDKVRYVGEPIGIVVAETEKIAEEALTRVKIKYKPLPGIFSFEEALSTAPPAIVHDAIRDYEVAVSGDDPRHQQITHMSNSEDCPPNLLYVVDGSSGDLESQFKSSDLIVEATYESKAFQNCCMEPHVAIAHNTPEQLLIWTSHQVPHQVKKELLEVYPTLSADNIAVKTFYVGGGFGNKETAFIETRIVAAALHFDRPVRLSFSRADEFLLSRTNVQTHVKDGVSKDGKLLAREVSIKFNVGAYNEEAIRMVRGLPHVVYGSYHIGAVKWHCDAVYTNLPPAAAFRGFGKPEVNWALERHMDKTAHKLGLDPLDFRAKNILREGDQNAIGETLGPNDTEGCLRLPIYHLRGLDLSYLKSIYPSPEWTFGTGFAYGNKPVSRLRTSISARLKHGPLIEISTGAPDIGQGSESMLTQIAAEEFGLDPSHIKIIAGNSEAVPLDPGPTGSRYTYHAGNALKLALSEIKEKVFNIASSHFFNDIPTEQLSLSSEGTISPIKSPNKSISLNDFFPKNHEDSPLHQNDLSHTAIFDSRVSGEYHAFWTPIGQAAIVAINNLTGLVKVLHFCTACDVGKAINPSIVEQQLEGGAAQGISSALYEEVIYENGHIINSNFKDYRIPTASELDFDSTTIILESNETSGPYGAKGVGEMGVMAAAPAIGNAIYDAIGIDMNIIPITPERILKAILDND